MKLFLFHVVLTALYISESDALSITLAIPNPTTVIVVPPDNTSVTLSWNYTLPSGEQISLILVDRSRTDKKDELVKYTSSKPSDNGVTQQFTSRMNFSVNEGEIHLVINNVVADDGNGFSYECQVITTSPNTDAKLVKLIVRVAAHNVAIGCDDTVLGQPMTCTCTADGDPAPTNFEWRASNGSFLGNGTSYTTPLVERTLNGNYFTCVASNGFGPNATKNTSDSGFDVKVAAHNVAVECDDAVLGQAMTCTCTADGDPAPTSFEWRASNGSFLGKGSSYTIPLVERTLHGNYFTCIASNGFGQKANKKTSDSGFDVKEKPRIVEISPHPSVTVNETDSITLKCNASGGIPAVYHYKWQRNGNDISGGENGTLILIDVQRNQNGNYSCQGCNTAGCTSNSTNLIVEYNPCKRSLCNNGGTCSPIISSAGVVSYKCDCISTLWKGKDCNESICDGICKNDGICNRADGKCLCSGFWIGETCENNVKETERELRLPSVRYLEDYKNIKSNASQQFALSFSREIVKESNAEGGKVIAIIKGSVIIHFVLYYNSTMSDEEIEKLLEKAVADGKIGSYEVDPYSLKQLSAPTIPVPEQEGLPVEIIVLIAVIASILVIVIIAVIIWKVKTRRCRRERKVTNGEEHKLGEKHLSYPSAGYSNSVLEQSPYIEDGPTATRRQDERSKEGRKPVDLYAEVDMSKKSKKKKPGEVLYADLVTFKPNVATENSNAQQPAKEPEKHQRTDYASITDVIKEEGGKSVKLPIAASDRNISNNGSTVSEP